MPERPLPIPAFTPTRHDLERWLGPLEAAIMAALWDAERPQTVKAIWRAVCREYKAVAYTTVMSTLGGPGRLYHKGWVERRKSGACHVYWPRETRAQFKDRMVEVIRESLGL